jgi:teichuronic acid exporter
MGDEINKLKVISSLLWKFMERSGTQGIQFIVQIILARLLAPEQFGIIALVMVFINIAQVFVQSGFNTALIQKKDADELDFSSVFYLSLFVAILLYVLIYFAAPYIADFYRDPILVSILRVLGFTLFFGVFNSIQNAYIARNMLFKKLFYCSIGATLISGAAGIIAAYTGYGVWALVIQQLLSQLSITIIMWFTVKWRPKPVISFKSVKVLFSFGWKILISSLLETIYVDLRTLIIGKIYSASTLGYYNRGQQFPSVIVSNINGSINSVMLPTLSVHQDDKNMVREIMRRAIVSSSFLIFPMMIGMAVVAEPLIKIVLTDKWLPAVPFLQIFCITYSFMPIQSANLQAINAMGRSDIYLIISIIKRVYGLIILLISIQFGVYAIAIGQALTAVLSSFLNAYPNKKLLDYSYKDQWIDIMPSVLVSMIMGSIIYLFKFLGLGAWETLILQVGSGIIIYVALSKILKLESFNYLVSTIKKLIDTTLGEQNRPV